MATRSRLVQINTGFDEQEYFPYSVGRVQAYAEFHLPNPAEYEFHPPIFRRERVADAVDQLKSVEIAGFSLYCWNEQLSMAIARQLKRERPSTLIVCGGPQVPRYDRPWEIEEFLTKYPFVDIVIHEAGEKPFLQVLQYGLGGSWSNIQSASWRENGGIHQTSRASGFKDLSEVPEPYLTGTFEPLMEAFSDVRWIGVTETTINCPFTCTFCGWARGGVGKPLLVREQEEVYRVIDWFVEHKTWYIFFCDANFGIRRYRDVEITEYIAQKILEYGFPRGVNLQDAKNMPEWTYKVRKPLAAVGMRSPVAIAIQSLHEPTLEAIKRDNIQLEAYHLNQIRYAKLGIPTVTDLILGLPEETYDSFVDGVCELIARGQHNRIHFNNLAMVPDAEMSDRDYRLKYGIETVWMQVVNIHGRIDSEEISEMQELVIATNTMPREDWVRARAFAWWVDLRHFDKLMQIPLILCHEVGGASYRELFELFAEQGFDQETLSQWGRIRRWFRQRLGAGGFFPTLDRTREFFLAKARAIQQGNVEYFHSQEWLDIYWPAHEYAMIELVTSSGTLDAFYNEAEELLEDHVAIDRKLLHQAIMLNRALLKLPFRTGGAVVECDWNILEFYRGVLEGESRPLMTGHHAYHINWDSDSWDSWERWYREVVWWCNRGGDYLLKPQAVSSEAA